MIQKWPAFQLLCCCGHTGLKRQVWQGGLASLLTPDASCSVTSLLPTLRSNKKPLGPLTGILIYQAAGR